MSSAEQQATNAALATLAATGNSYALGQLWETNRGLIRSMFWKWYPHHKSLADQHGVTADDFEQEGFFAVQYAARTYAPAAGAFSTWLAQAMQRQIQLALSNGHRRKFVDEDGKSHTTSADPLNHCFSLDLPIDSENADGPSKNLCRITALSMVPQRSKASPSTARVWALDMRSSAAVNACSAADSGHWRKDGHNPGASAHYRNPRTSKAAQRPETTPLA